MGHMNEGDCRKSVQHLEHTISRRSMEKCVACAESKAQQKSLPTITEAVKKEVHIKEVPKTVNECVCLDISTIKVSVNVKVTVTKLQWLILVDERTEMKWSMFHQRKSGFIETLCTKFQHWKDAGENKLLEEQCNSADWKLSI
eukprot:183609-Ditylum_brightwellii.AAC.1